MRRLGHGSEALMNEISGFIKETPQSSLLSSFLLVRWKLGDAIYELESGSSLDTESGSTLTLNFPTSGTVGNNLLLLISYQSMVFFVIASQID